MYQAVLPSVIVSDHSGPQASQDQDDSSILRRDSSLSTYRVTSSVLSDKEQFPLSTCDDTTLDAPIGVPPLPVLQEGPSTSVTTPGQALPSCSSSSPETPGPRAQRQRKPPLYLNAYVRF